MKSKLLFVLLLITSGLVAQKLPREVLNGQVLSESMSVEDILITNKTAKTATVSKKDGTFQILVRVKDTLIFSGFNLPRQILVLNDADLKFNVLKIKLESQASPLDEVVINPNALSGDLNKDNKNIKVATLKAKIDNQTAIATLYEDDLQSTPENKLMPGYLDSRYMMDFNKIGRKLVRAFKRNEAQKNKNRDVTRFSVVVENRFSDDFFRNTLNIDPAETSAFLIFCESDPNSKKILSIANDFELIEFLKVKKQEYLASKK